MKSLKRHFGDLHNPAVTNAIESIEKNPAFEPTVRFVLNQLCKSCLEQGSSNRKNCYFFMRDDGHVTLIHVLDIHI